MNERWVLLRKKHCVACPRSSTAAVVIRATCCPTNRAVRPCSDAGGPPSLRAGRSEGGPRPMSAHVSTCQGAAGLPYLAVALQRLQQTWLCVLMLWLLSL
eukprot:353546-Chlamydomonas_euryale.AAC.4